MRLGKILLAIGMGLFLVFAALNNTLTYQDTFNPVNAVASMQATFKLPPLMWRAVESPALVWIAVIGIILMEYIAGFFCLLGGLKMWKARKASAEQFHISKGTALLGLTITAVFYFIAFQVVVGEWFMWWQNREADTLAEAFRNFASAMLMMMWINNKDSD